MHDRHGHLDDHAFLQEVLVVEHSVLANEAGSSAVSVDTEHLLKCGVQEVALVSHSHDAKGPLRLQQWVRQDRDRFQFVADVSE